MAVNKHPAPCSLCGHTVPVNGGKLERKGRRWIVTHLSCGEAGEGTVISFEVGDQTFTQNSRGRCIDAPCCGCCT
jgi:hypothetical protein